MALENRGAVFTLRANGDFVADLDRCEGVTTEAEAEDLAGLVTNARRDTAGGLTTE